MHPATWRLPHLLLCLLSPLAWATGVPEPAPGPGPTEAPPASPAWDRAALSPYFAEGPLRAAKEAFDQRRYPEARALLAAAEPTPPVRFLLALAALKAQDAAAAAPAFEALAADYPALRDRCLLLAGQAAEQLPDWAAAERVYGQVGPASRLAGEAALGRARALRQLARPGEAVAGLRALADQAAPPWGRDLAAEALLELADALAATRDPAGARDALLQLWSIHPGSPQARKAQDRLGDPASLPPAAVVARGEALVEAHQNAQGEGLLAPLLPRLPLPEPLGCRAALAVGRAQRKQRAHARAIATLEPVARRCAGLELKVKALYLLGTSQGFAAPAQAAATFESLAALAPGHPLADDALLLAAQAHQQQGEPEQARQDLARLVDELPDSDSAPEALFRLFWQAQAEGRRTEALALLTELEERHRHAEDSFEAERARYWRGRVLEGLQRPEDALGLYSDLAREHPTTYYGLIARERVEALDPPRGAALVAAAAAEVATEPEAGGPFPLHPGPLAADATFLAAAELARLGLGELATPEVLAVDRRALSREGLQLLVVVLAAAGEERAAHALARVWLRPELSGPITAQRRALWEIAYPRAYREEVLRGARALDPDLLQALMREESALDPRALSWAGALGLCQLMPATAAEAAGQLKLPRPSARGLFDPELNLRLGGWYLGQLLQRAGGTTQFALAGYNAGEAAVARWRKENGEADLAAWVELIPIPETRGYVRRVLRSYATYKLLYARGSVPRTVQVTGLSRKVPGG